MNPSSHAPPIAAPLGDVQSARLDLRRFEEGDLDELAAVFADPAVWEFPFGRGFTRHETEAFLARQLSGWAASGFGLWVARTLNDGRIVGYVGLSVPEFLPEILPAVEVGWRFAPSAWGKGYATEGATTALEEAFATLQLDRVCSVPQVGNPRSAQVAERLGMSLVREVAIAATERRGELRGLLYEMERDRWIGRHD